MGAENSPGLKLATDAAGHCELRFALAVGERSTLIEVRPTRTGGRCGSETVSMSSDKEGENPSRRKSKVS